MIEVSISVLGWFIKRLKWCIKSEVISLGLCDDVKKIDYGNYSRYILHKPIQKYDDLFIDTTIKHGAYYIKVARNINNANSSRVRRLKKRIMKYLSLGQCLFVTLTFSNDVLDSTSVSTRRKYVQKYLKSKSSHYIANIDYGNKNEREHYHAVILIDQIDDTWEYGFAKYKKVYKANSEIALSRYVLKLTNHAIKESTKQNFCIYSRS